MKIPKAIKYILWMDCADKYSFYGMKAILPMFLLNVIMFNEAKTVAIMQTFLSITYLSMIISTIIAGRLISYKNLVTLAAFISFAGHIILSYSNQAWNVYMGVIIISLGSGIISICMPALTVEQCNDDKPIIKKSISLIYLFKNIGTVSILITPLVYHNFGYKLAFLSPTIAMFLAGFILLIGKKYYIVKKEKNDFTDYFSDFKLMKNLFWAMFVSSVFYVFMSQIYSSWIIQGHKMVGDVLGFRVLPAQMQFLDTIFVVTLLPVILFKIIPYLQNKGWLKTSISQINIGLFIGCLSFIFIVILQYLIERGIVLNLMWQIIPYFFIAVSEVLVMVITMNYLFSSLPANLSIKIGLIYAIFNFSTNTIFTYVFHMFKIINIDFFVFCTIVLLVVAILSTLIGKKLCLQE